MQWILIEEQGFWGSPGPDVELSPRLNRHGTYRPPGYKREATISLTGRCYAPTYTALRRAEADVLGLLSDPQQPGTLTCHSEIGPLSCEVYLDDTILCVPVEAVSEPGIEFSMQLVAPDPRKHGADWHEMTTGLPSAPGESGLDFEEQATGETAAGLNFGDPAATDAGLVFGAGNASGIVRLTNAGTAPANPVFTLHGPLTNPTLTAGPATLRYNDTLAVGETLVIDPSAPSVLLGGTASRRHLLSPAAFDGFVVPAAERSGQPGVLPVGLSHAGSSSATGWIQARMRSAWF